MVAYKKLNLWQKALTAVLLLGTVREICAGDATPLPLDCKLLREQVRLDPGRVERVGKRRTRLFRHSSGHRRQRRREVLRQAWELDAQDCPVLSTQEWGAGPPGAAASTVADPQGARGDKRGSGEKRDEGDRGKICIRGLQGPLGLPGPAGEDGTKDQRPSCRWSTVDARPDGRPWVARGEYRIDLREKSDEIAILRGALAASQAEVVDLKTQMLTMSTCMKAMIRSLTTREPLNLDHDLIFKVWQLPDLPRSDADPREASAPESSAIRLGTEPQEDPAKADPHPDA